MKTSEIQPLVNQKEFPAISIIMPTHPPYPHFKIDEMKIKEVTGRIESMLRKNYSEVKTKQMLSKVNKTIKEIDFTSLPKSLAIYVSPSVEKVFYLPFEVPQEKAIVSDTFEIRDLVFSLKRERNYLLVILSKNNVKTYYGFRDGLSEVEFEDMPLNVADVMNEHSSPGWGYFDTEAWKEKNIRNYIHFIDEEIDKELRRNFSNAIPSVILMGDTKLLGYFKQMTSHPERIAGMIEGNYENANWVELRKKIRPVFRELDARDEENALTQLAGGINTNHFAAGIVEVWRAVEEKKCRMLLVEKDYHQHARQGTDKYTIIIDEEVDNVRNTIPDAVDDIIEKAFNNGSEIVFMGKDKLKEYQRIACVTYY